MLLHHQLLNDVINLIYKDLSKTFYMLSLVTILSNASDCMYILHNDQTMVVFDPFDKEVLQTAQNCIFTNVKHTSNELAGLEKGNKRTITHVFLTGKKDVNLDGINELEIGDIYAGEGNKSAKGLNNVKICKEKEDVSLEAGQTITCIPVPNNTDGLLCYYFNDTQQKYVVTGEILSWLCVENITNENATEIYSMFKDLFDGKNKLDDERICLYGKFLTEKNREFYRNNSFKLDVKVEHKNKLTVKQEKENNVFIQAILTNDQQKGSEEIISLQEKRNQ